MVDKGAIERLKMVASTPFERCTYTRAIELLEDAVKGGKKFEFPVRSWHALPACPLPCRPQGACLKPPDLLLELLDLRRPGEVWDDLHMTMDMKDVKLNGLRLTGPTGSDAEAVCHLAWSLQQLLCHIPMLTDRTPRRQGKFYYR